MRHHLRYTLYSIMIWLAACLLLSAAAATLPVNGSFERGAGSITTSGTAMSITASAARNVIAWDSFDIASGYSVAFDGNDYLNFVRSTSNGGAGTVSVIAGTLTAGGTVYLVNPWGINIKTDAVIDIEGGLGLSTTRISSDDLDVFEGTGALEASLTGIGRIRVQSEQLSADSLFIDGSHIIIRDAAALTDTAGATLTEVSVNSSSSIVDIGSSDTSFDYAAEYTNISGSAAGYNVNGSYINDLTDDYVNSRYLDGQEGFGLIDHSGQTPIATADEFWAIADDLSGTYWLTDDIDLGEVINRGITNFQGTLYGAYNYLTYTLVIDDARDSSDTTTTDYYYGLFSYDKFCRSNFYTLGIDFSLRIDNYPEPLTDASGSDEITQLHVGILAALNANDNVIGNLEVVVSDLDLGDLAASAATAASASTAAAAANYGFTALASLKNVVNKNSNTYTERAYSMLYSEEALEALDNYTDAVSGSYAAIAALDGDSTVGWSIDTPLTPSTSWQMYTKGSSTTISATGITFVNDTGLSNRMVGFMLPFYLPEVTEVYNNTNYNYVDYLDATSDLYPWSDFLTLDYDNSILTARDAGSGVFKIYSIYDSTARGGYYLMVASSTYAYIPYRKLGTITKRELGALEAETLTSTVTVTSTAVITDVMLENDDGALSGTIEVTLTDEDGGTQTLTFDVTATLGDDGTLSEVSIANSDDFTAELSGSYDADTGLLTATLSAASSDGNTTLTVSVSDSVDSGSGELSTVSAVVSGSELTVTTDYTAVLSAVSLENDDGALSGTIEVTLTDEDGGTQTLTFDVTATLGGDGTISEVSIANSDDFTAELSGSYDADTGLLTATLSAASSDGSTTLTVSVSDSVDDGSGSGSTVLSYDNAISVEDLLAYLGLSDDEELDWAEGESAESYDFTYTITDSEGNEVSVIDLDDEGAVYTISVAASSELAANYTYTTTTSTFTVTTPVSTAESGDAAETTVTDSGDQATGADADGVDTGDDSDGTGTDVSADTPETQDGDSGDDDTDTGSRSGGAGQNAETAEEEDASGNSDGNADTHDLPELRQLAQLAQDQAGELPQPSASDFADAVSATGWWWWDMLAPGGEERADAGAGDTTAAAGAGQGNGDDDAGVGTGDGRISITSALTAVPAQLCQAPRTASEQRQLQRCLWQAGDDLAARLECLCAGTAEGHSGEVYGLVQP